MFRIVQPWGNDPAREGTTLSQHETAEEAFAEIDRLAIRMVKTGSAPDSVKLVVVNPYGEVIYRPAH
jgi:hypothetical protein